MSKLSQFFQFLKAFEYRSLLTPRKIFVITISIFLVGSLTVYFLMRSTDFAKRTEIRGYFEEIGVLPSTESSSEVEESIEKEDEDEDEQAGENEETDSPKEEEETDDNEEEEIEDAEEGEYVGDDNDQSLPPQGSADILYPTLQSVTDGIGHTQYGSIANNNTSLWEYQTVTVGDTLTFSIVSDNPNNSTLSYRFEYQAPNSSFRILRNWGSSSTVTWTIPENVIGKWLYVKASVRDADGIIRYENCDDYTLLTYTVNPAVNPEDLYPEITQVSDSNANINTNSWGGDNSGDWSSGVTPTLSVGDTVTFSVLASDPNGDSLKYIFMYQPEGTGFNILKNWSTSNTFSWTIPSSLVNTQIIMNLGIKDSDAYLQFGDNDDYTYMIYNIVE